MYKHLNNHVKENCIFFLGAERVRDIKSASILTPSTVRGPGFSSVYYLLLKLQSKCQVLDQLQHKVFFFSVYFYVFFVLIINIIFSQEWSAVILLFLQYFLVFFMILCQQVYVLFICFVYVNFFAHKFYVGEFVCVHTVSLIFFIFQLLL